MNLDRRGFLNWTLRGAVFASAGLVVPTKAYSFLWNNPLAKSDRDFGFELRAFAEKPEGSGLLYPTSQGGYVVPIHLRNQILYLLEHGGVVRKVSKIENRIEFSIVSTVLTSPYRPLFNGAR